MEINFINKFTINGNRLWDSRVTWEWARFFFRSLSNEKETRKLKSREFLVEIGGLSRFIIEASAKHCIIVFYFVRRVAQPNGASVCLARAYIAFISIQWWWQTTTSFVLSIPSVVSFTHPQSLLVVENLKTLLVHRKKKRKKELFFEKKNAKAQMRSDMKDSTRIYSLCFRVQLAVCREPDKD